MYVPLEVELLNITPKAAELVEKVAAISYRTQRFQEKIAPTMVTFKSGRKLPLDELGIDHIPVSGEVILGFTKDDKCVAKVDEATCNNVVRFLRKIGHWKLFEMPTATFLIKGISRKSALHYLRYEYLTTNMQSQKYLNQKSFQYTLPNKGEESDENIKKIEKVMAQIQGVYEDLRETDMDPEWARGILPNLTAQTITLHTNFRQWCHIGCCLLAEDYVSENRKLVSKIFKILKTEAPVFFEEFVEDENGIWKVPSVNRNVCVNFSLGTREKEKLGIEIPQIETEYEIP